jgi:hypothetical protein
MGTSETNYREENVEDAGELNYKEAVINIYPDAICINSDQIYHGDGWFRDNFWYYIILGGPWVENRRIKYLGEKQHTKDEAWESAYEWILEQALEKLES